MRQSSLLSCLLLCACAPPPERVPQSAQEPAPAAATASKKWAEPLERPGLPNLHRVTPTLYRGAQPTDEGFRELARMGVKSVISLRGFHPDDIPDELPLLYERISFKPWHSEDEDLVQFLRLVSDPARQPVYVHCQMGADRTGLMIAVERIVLEGWTKEAAIEEMTQGAFGFHAEWRNLVKHVRELDVERLTREAGVKR